MRSQPGDHCEPHVFQTGNIFRTNQSIFPWEIMSTPKFRDGTGWQARDIGGVTYYNNTLTACDVSYVTLSADLSRETVQMQVRLLNFRTALSADD